MNEDVSGQEFHENEFVEIPDEQWTGTPKEMHKRASTIMRAFASVRNPHLGEVRFTGKGRDKTLFDKRTPHEFQSVQALPGIVSKGKLFSSQPDRKNRPEIVAVHRLEHGLKIGDVKYRAEVIVRETKTGAKTAHQFYLHRIVKN
jgi:hypothetical protein